MNTLAQPLDYKRIYRECFTSIAHYVQTHGGSVEDAQDIFQEGLLVLWEKENTGLVLTASEKTFLYAVCKNLWLKRKRRSSRFLPLGEFISQNGAVGAVETEEEADSLFVWVKKLLQRITAHCSRLIRDMFYHGKDIDEIQLEYGYSSRQNAINQKYKCMSQLRKASKKNDPGG